VSREDHNIDPGVRNTVFGIDRIQALVLAVRAVDMKLGRLALATKAELQFLDKPKFAVFTELEGFDRLGNSLVNCLDALQLAQRPLRESAASVRRSQRSGERSPESWSRPGSLASMACT
jgi:hypothetical protein